MISKVNRNLGWLAFFALSVCQVNISSAQSLSDIYNSAQPEIIRKEMERKKAKQEIEQDILEVKRLRKEIQAGRGDVIKCGGEKLHLAFIDQFLIYSSIKGEFYFGDFNYGYYNKVIKNNGFIKWEDKEALYSSVSEYDIKNNIRYTKKDSDPNVSAVSCQVIRRGNP
jgi:hypothetical protein